MLDFSFVDRGTETVSSYKIMHKTTVQSSSSSVRDKLRYSRSLEIEMIQFVVY